MTRMLPTLFRSTLSTLILSSLMVTMAPLKAQLVFIPDVNMRAKFDSIAPGCMDTNGYMDTTHQGVVQLTDELYNWPLIINWPNSDLTGIQHFSSMTSLWLRYAPNATSTTIPAFPASMGALKLDGYPSATAPPLPDGMYNAFLNDCAFTTLPAMPSNTLQYLWLTGCTDLTFIDTLPQTLSYFYMDSLTSLGSWPQLPQSLQTLGLRQIPLSAYPVLPMGLLSLSLNGLPATNMPPLPSSLGSLSVTDMLISSMPAYPQNLSSLQLDNLPLSILPPYPGVMSVISYNDLPAQTLPAWPSSLPHGYGEYRVKNMPQLNAIPAWPSGSTDLVLELEGLPSLTSLPNWPVNNFPFQLKITDLAGLAQLPPWPTGSSYLTVLARDLPLVTTIPEPPVDIEDLHLDGFPSVISISDLGSIQQGYRLRIEDFPALTSITEWPVFVEHKYVIDCPMLECIPHLPQPPFPISTPDLYVQNTGITCAPNGVVRDLGLGMNLPLCSPLNSTCPNIWPLVTGQVFHDQNNNGVWDSGEAPYPNVTIEATPGNHMTSSQANGYYEINFPPGNYTVSAVPGLYQSVSTQPYNANVPNMGTIDSLVNIGVHTIPNVQDLRAQMDAYQPRPGFSNQAWLRTWNVGTDTVTPTMTFMFDPIQSWVNSSPPPAQISGNTASWVGPTLAPGAFFGVNVTLYTDSTVALGTLIMHQFQIDPLATDTTPSDNTIAWSDTVVGSYDPNDKLLSPAAMTPAEVQAGNTPIDYTIRFQNTGTYQAERVVIVDTLSTDLQWESFQFIGSSHPCNWYMSEGVLHFIFDPIVLPDSTTDEPNSHGFVKFSILPSDLLQNGEMVENIAHIVFDFNEPIVTPPAVFTVDLTVDVAEAEAEGLMVYPNPATDQLHLQFDQQWVSEVDYTIRDIMGRVLKSGTIQSSRTVFSTTDLPAGSYLLQVEDHHRTATARFVKR